MPPKKIPSVKCFSNRAEIVLAGGQIALIDLDDIEKIKKHPWFKSKHKNRPEGYGYVKSQPWIPELGRTKSILMHRYIFGDAANGFWVDHINRNILDNRKSNLRFVTPTQSSQNRIVNGGVIWVPRSDQNRWGTKDGRWRARIRIDGHLYHLGYFDRREDALIAHRDAAKLAFGEYAPKDHP